MSERCHELRDAIEAYITEGYRSKVKAGDWYYAGPPDFVLRHGECFEASPLPRPYPYRRYRAKQACFFNAGRLVFEHPDALTYVEGYAFGAPELPTPILHAWCVEGDGRVIDPTWQHIPQRGPYFGVRFHTQVVSLMWLAWNKSNDKIGPIIDDAQRNWVLLQQRWLG